jgi:hypothetical protein
MRSIRRGKRILITVAGPATFEVPWKRDAQYIIPLMQEDQNTGEIIALHDFAVSGVIATARKRPFESEFMKSWPINANLISQYAEIAWNIMPNDLDLLTWKQGQESQVIFVDFTATTVENSVSYTRALEDAAGNFIFPLRVYQAMSEVPS